MKNLIAMTILTLLFISCKGKTGKKMQQESTVSVVEEKVDLDTSHFKEILQTATDRYSYSLNNNNFKLPYNYRISFITNENGPNNYYKFRWEVNSTFVIDSESEGFKRFVVSNFIQFIPSSSDQGEFLIVKNQNSDQLTIQDFLNSVDEVIYSDENSAIFKSYGKLQAFYFEYLPVSKEYIVYLSKTPFWNIRPELSVEKEINQLFYHLRMAKNICRPIEVNNPSWKSYKNQFSMLENEFLEGLNTEVVNAFESDKSLVSYTVRDQGNIPYYTVFKSSTAINDLWGKLHSIKNMDVLTVEDTDKVYDYLRENGFRFFYAADYQPVYKNDLSVVYQRKSQQAYCLVTKTKKDKYIIFKEFPALMEMDADYYKNEINFYRELFENFE